MNIRYIEAPIIVVGDKDLVVDEARSVAARCGQTDPSAWSRVLFRR